MEVNQTAKLNTWDSVDTAENYRLWEEFIKTWPIERVRSMTLQEYTNLNREDSFIYWLEFRLVSLGSIKGGSAFKFGIFARGDEDDKESKDVWKYTSKYGWLAKYGSSPEEAFLKVKTDVISVIDAVQRVDLEAIEAVELGKMFKWKLAFQYQNMTEPCIVPIFFDPALHALTQSSSRTPIFQIHKTLLADKPEGVDLFEYGRELWNKYISMVRIWKVSHGKDNFSSEERQECLSQNIIRVHGSTAKGQGKSFTKEAKIGDYFYLCHGNDDGIQLFGCIESEPAQVTHQGDDGWFDRKFTLIEHSLSKNKYDGTNKAWAPNYNSTFKEVPKAEHELFDINIAIPYFGKPVKELISPSVNDKESTDHVLALFFNKLKQKLGLKGSEDIRKFFWTHSDAEISSRYDVFGRLVQLKSEDAPSDKILKFLSTEKIHLLKGHSSTSAQQEAFLKHVNAQNIIDDLLAATDTTIVKATELFISEAVALGFHDKQGCPKRSEAALLASVILSGTKPKQFVDYRQDRWNWAAEVFRCSPYISDKEAPYGAALRWAGSVARQIGDSPAFQDVFGTDDHILWTVSGFVYTCFKDPELKAMIEQSSLLNTTVKEETDMNTTKINLLPTNTILYGPPGTGKTYHSINHALALCKNVPVEVVDEKDKVAHKSVRTEYDSFCEQGRIVFCTFHQSMSYEDFVEGIKPQTIDDKVAYPVVPGVFSEICERARNNWEDSRKVGTVSFDRVWKAYIEPLLTDESDSIDVETKKGSFKIYDVNDRTIYFEKQNGSRLHTLSIRTLKRLFQNPEQLLALGGLQTYYRGLVERLNQVQLGAQEHEELQQFVLIIDEINRGNVSAILGELITLLEPDKRLGQDNELRVTLPYSKDPDFGVPPNLHIIGTMNTADRSVEALDTALRRRFSFVEMLPDTSMLKEITIEDVHLDTLLQTINKRIEYLLDKDHSIGHSYFMKVKSLIDLQTVFKDKIIPLLQEYFYGDYNKIGLVLGKGFVDVSDEEPKFADGDFDSAVAEVKIYNLLHPTGNDFIAALKSLLNMSSTDA